MMATSLKPAMCGLPWWAWHEKRIAFAFEDTPDDFLIKLKIIDRVSLGAK
jgi:hypothetical protein